MRATLFFILGFGATLLAHTLFGTYAFITEAIVVALALFFLFFRSNPQDGLLFTIGLAVAQEFFGNAHLGLASTLGLGLVLLYQLFALQLHFTARFLRYLTALLIALALYATILFPLTGLVTRLLDLLILFPILSIIFYFLSSLGEKPTYELL